MCDMTIYYGGPLFRKACQNLKLLHNMVTREQGNKQAKMCCSPNTHSMYIARIVLISGVRAR